jgi:hypothetical protein
MPWWLKPRLCQIVFGCIYAAGSTTILTLTAIGPYKNTDGKNRSIKGWYYTVITGGFLTVSIIYYYVFLWNPRSSLVRLAGVQLVRKKHGVGDNDDLRRQCDMCIYYTQRDGSTGQEHRHAIYGYLNYNDLRFPGRSQGRNLLYWVFGGPSSRHYLKFDFGDRIRTARDRISGAIQAVQVSTRRIIPGL